MKNNNTCSCAQNTDTNDYWNGFKDNAIVLQATYECSHHKAELVMPLTYSDEQFPRWPSTNVTELYRAKMRAKIDICAKTVDVEVFDITSQYVAGTIADVSFNLKVGADDHDVLHRDSSDQTEYVVWKPMEVPGTDVSSDIWYPEDGISDRSNRTFYLYMVPTIIDGWYSVHGFPDETKNIGHNYHPRFELGLKLEAGYMSEKQAAIDIATKQAYEVAVAAEQEKIATQGLPNPYLTQKEKDQIAADLATACQTAADNNEPLTPQCQELNAGDGDTILDTYVEVPLPGYTQIKNSGLTFISQNQFVIELDKPISASSWSEGTYSSSGSIDYYTDGVESSCPRDLGGNAKSVKCPPGVVCEFGAANRVGQWASWASLVACLAAGAALIFKAD